MSNWLGGWGIVTGWLKVKGILTAETDAVVKGILTAETDAVVKGILTTETNAVVKGVLTAEANAVMQNEVDLQGTGGIMTINRLTTTQRNALSPVNGMMIYNTTTNAFEFYENGVWVTMSGDPPEIRVLVCGGEPSTKSTSFGLKLVDVPYDPSDNGYVMVRSGSITGVSMSFNLISVSSSMIRINVEVNGSRVFYKEVLYTDTGWKTQYAVQESGIDTFNAGDLIGLYVTKEQGTYEVDDTIGVVELTF